MPTWSTEVVRAVERWASTERSSAVQGWRLVGTAAPHERGWLIVDRRDGRINLDTLDQPCLAGARGPEAETAYPVDDFREVDGVLLLKEPPNLPVSSRGLWARSLSPRFLLDKLVEGLRSPGPAPLAEALAERRLDGRPSSSRRATGLLDAQQEAFRACLSPGLRMIWGPPGTGKTRVLAAAIEQLLDDGKRVLLVSTANVAVDNALLAVVQRLRPPAGAAVRVGPAQVREIAVDPAVQLDLLAAAASATADAERNDVGRALAPLLALDRVVADLEVALADFDEDRYRDIRARMDAHERREQAQAALAMARAAVERALAVAQAARSDLAQADRAATDLDIARQALARHHAAGEELARLDREQQSLDGEREALRLLSAPGGWVAGRRHRRRLQDATATAAAHTDDNADRRAGLLALQQQAAALFDATTGPALDAAERRLTWARRAVDDAVVAHQRAEGAMATAHRALVAVPTTPSPSNDDRAFVTACDRTGRPRDADRLEDLRHRRHRDASSRGELEARHRTLVDRARALRRDAETKLIDDARLVATTLARSRVHRALAGAAFDVVLVDEVGAATLAEVLLALSRATTTAVLLGDFLQLPPVLKKEVKDDPSPEVDTWVRNTCFSHVGIRTPADVRARAGCLALTHQFRFGPELRRMANDVVYEVLQDARDLPGISTNPSTEVVLVDVSTLSDLADIRYPTASGGRWWMAGALLSRALAELHLPEDGPVGVVTPYRAQAEATLAALRDRNLLAGVAVGTVHAFQGREYPTVVFDLVEDGRGWIAKGRRNAGDYAYDGLKVFGVGVTRARHRLYLIADGRAVGGAAAGPLRALRDAVDRGDARRWSAAALLGLDEPPASDPDSAFAAASALLQQLVAVREISDEHTFAAELGRHLAGAHYSMWMWSPWIAKNARIVVPLIKACVERGVDCRVFLRPDHDRLVATNWAQERLIDLRATGATVIRSDHEHRKIVVIDERTVLLGSLNALSHHPGSTREVMITMEGREFAERLLTELRITDLGTPKACPSCSTQMEVRRRNARQPTMFWHCRGCDRRTEVPAPRRSTDSRRKSTTGRSAR